MSRHSEMTQNLINGLVELGTVAGMAEAIAISLGSLKNSEGKLVGRVNLNEDFSQNMEFCWQIAEMLTNKKRGEV